MLLEHLVGFRIVFLEFLGHVRRHVRVEFLDLFSDFERIFGRNVGFSVTQELLYEPGDIATSNRDMFQSGTNDVAVDLKRLINDYTERDKAYDRNDVRNTVAAIDNRAGQGSFRLFTRPTRRQRQDSLHSDIHSFNSKCLKHNFSQILSVLGGIQRRFGLDRTLILCKQREKK